MRSAAVPLSSFLKIQKNIANRLAHIEAAFALGFVPFRDIGESHLVTEYKDVFSAASFRRHEIRRQPINGRRGIVADRVGVVCNQMRRAHNERIAQLTPVGGDAIGADGGCVLDAPGPRLDMNDRLPQMSPKK
jgi:hypothetical protein